MANTDSNAEAGTESRSEQVLDATRKQAQRYLEARYGKDVWYRAPETFDNTLERWIWAVASDVPELAEKCIAAIERHFGEARDGS